MIVKYWWANHTSGIDNFSILKTDDNEYTLYGLNDKLHEFPLVSLNSKEEL